MLRKHISFPLLRSHHIFNTRSHKPSDTWSRQPLGTRSHQPSGTRSHQPLCSRTPQPSCTTSHQPLGISNYQPSHTTGWSKESDNCNMSLTCWNRTNKKLNPRVHIGRLDYLSFFYFLPEFWSLKKNCIFSGNQWKVANYTRCKKILLSNIQCIFGHFWRSQQKNWCHIMKSVFKVG